MASRTYSRRSLVWVGLFAGLLAGAVTARADSPPPVDKRLNYYSETLHLSAEQRTRVASILATDRTLAEIDRNNFKGDSTAFREATLKRVTETKKEIAAVLSPEQKQLFADLKPMHTLGLGVLELSTRLHLEPSQREQVEQIVADARLGELRDEMRKAGDNPEAQKAAASAMNQAMERIDKQIERILTKDQKNEYKKFKEERRQQMEERRPPEGESHGAGQTPGL